MEEKRTLYVSGWSALAWGSRVRARSCVRIGAVGILALASSAAQHAAAPAPAVTCANCHQRVTDFYAHSPMRHAMADEGANAGLEAHSNLSAQKNGYTYTVQTKNGKSTYTVSDGTGTLSLPIRWA